MQSDDGQTCGADEERQGVMEELKCRIRWHGWRMNNIRACAEEIVLMNVVYMN